MSESKALQSGSLAEPLLESSHSLFHICQVNTCDICESLGSQQRNLLQRPSAPVQEVRSMGREGGFHREKRGRRKSSGSDHRF